MPDKRKTPDHSKPDLINIFSTTYSATYERLLSALLAQEKISELDPELLKKTREQVVASGVSPIVEPFKPTTVEGEKFKENLEQTFGVLRDSFATVMKPVAGLIVDEIEVALEVSAEGKIGILGSGVGIAGKSSMTVHFKRQS